MNRIQIKTESKNILNNHFPFFLLMFLPVFIIEALSGIGNYRVSKSMSHLGYNLTTQNVASYSNYSMAINIFSMVSALLLIGIMFVCIDSHRGNNDYQNPLQQGFTIVKSGQYFLGSIVISILTMVYTILWTFLLIIPGIIKSFSYSQAIYIYRDAIDRGELMGYNEAITKSRELMDGHKMDYFVLQLSFIGWFIFSILLIGIPFIWVQPYYYLTMANFYNKLVSEDTRQENTEEKAA